MKPATVGYWAAAGSGAGIIGVEAPRRACILTRSNEMEDIRMRPCLALVLVGTLLAPPLWADASRDERLEAAHDYVQRAVADMDLEEIVRSMWRPAVASIEASGTQLTTSQRRRIETLYYDIYTDRLRDLMLSQDELMADLMTLDEIQALRDFYATPEGRSVMQKLPKILNAQQPQIIELVKSTMPEVLSKMQGIVDTP
ncbi:hypothetical protein CCR90_07180 [Rhodovulum sulfidophilum]|nr:hypothetical protein [Rhodovulum sulfidophilum]